MATPSHWGARPSKTTQDPERNSSEVDQNVKKTNQNREENVKNHNAILVQEFIVCGPRDGKSPNYLDIACLPNGRVVFVDGANNRCSLYDSSYNYVSDWMLFSTPWGICTADTDEVAVALPEEKKIQFLKVNDSMQPSGDITTRRKCLSVVALSKMELVYVGTTRSDKTYYWGVVTRDGFQRSCFHIPRVNIKYCSVYIALNSSKTRAYIACFDNQIVYCVGLDGIIYCQYFVQEGASQFSPYGIQLDRGDNVYVAVRDSHSIHLLSPDCQLQFVLKDMIPKFPRVICFQPSGDKFLLFKAVKDIDVCYIYELK